jgi:hypothetical protein
LVPYSVYRRIRIKRSGQFDLILKPQSSLKNCIDLPLESVVRIPVRIGFQFNFSCPVDTAATDFSGLKPLPSNFMSLIKETVP